MINSTVTMSSAKSVIPDLASLSGPRFVVTVDTEEEFDWTAPFSRDGYGLSHIAYIPRFQGLCDETGVKPCYLIDYPITQNDEAAELLGGYAASDQAEIGVQLHPWVNPPFSEQISVHNSFACNLPPELEREKLGRLYAAIVERIGVRPDAYRAGRYGIGPETPAMLTELGIAIDTSTRPRFDYSVQGGPNYARHPVMPYWLIPYKLLELPLTTVFSGALRGAGDAIFESWFSSVTARAFLARSNMLERISLTPEGIPLQRALLAIDLALAEGLPILNLSFHSPSLAPGHTPYVRTDEDLEAFYLWWRAVLAHLKQRGVRATTMAEIKSATCL
jgi:hypothetical protein